MKRILFCSGFICLVLLASCKKDKTDINTVSYMSFKINGVQKTYKAKTVATQVAIDGGYGLALTAYENDSSKEMMFLDISQESKAITVGAYVDPGPDVDSLVVVGGYNAGTDDDAKLYGAGLQVDNNPRLHITITSKTDKNVKGTFYGTFYDHGGDGTGTVACTDGKFSLPLY